MTLVSEGANTELSRFCRATAEHGGALGRRKQPSTVVVLTLTAHLGPLSSESSTGIAVQCVTVEALPDRGKHPGEYAGVSMILDNFESCN